MGLTKRVFSGSPWEKQVGYCRAIQVGNHIYISGYSGLLFLDHRLG